MGGMNCSGRRSASLVLALFAAFSSWSGQGISPNVALAIYSRTTNQFAAGIFLKPAQATNAGLACQLAPLIIQQVPDGPLSADASRDQFGAPGISNGVPALNPSRPAVYWAADTVPLNGRVHVRLSWQWWYPPRPSSSYVAATLPRQGVRITLDSQGRPAIWEILTDTSGRQLVFISGSLEAAAAAEFGKPLAGRQYSIERSLEEAPDVIVPRVIDDGPMADGPIVYLGEGTRNVCALICRCMPAQVKQLAATRTFDLIPLDAGAMNALQAAAGADLNALPAVWPGDRRSNNHLGTRLRLPAKF